MATNAGPNIDEYSLITARLIKDHTPALKEAVDPEELSRFTGQLAVVLDLALQGFEKKQPAADIVHRLGEFLDAGGAPIGRGGDADAVEEGFFV